MNTPEPELRTPEGYAGDRRPINTDPREQRGPAINPTPYYQPQWPERPSAGMPLPQRRRHSPLYWSVIGFIIIVIILGGLAAFAALSFHSVTLAPKSFTVGDQPTLVFNDDSGDVHIVSGPDHQITVSATERLSTWNSHQITPQYQQNGDTITVTFDEETRFSFGLSYYDLQIDVTVPSNTNLTVTADSGNITNDGAHGQMSLHTDSGTITTNGGSGQITLNADSGNITANNISGQMTLTADSGNITATNASASGTSLFQSDSGNITFSGSLDPAGHNQFKADSGNITLTLPSNAAFQLQASTDSGDIDSQFDGVSILGDDGKTAQGQVGDGPPFAQVTIQTDSGNIDLYRS